MPQPCLLIDLDNTLWDRQAGFRQAIALISQGVDAELVASWLDELESLDAWGEGEIQEWCGRWSMRWQVAYDQGLAPWAPDPEDLWQRFAAAVIEFVFVDQATRATFAALGRHFTCAIVSDGNAQRQADKWRRTGLDAELCVYSSTLGTRKPDRRVFEHALKLLGVSAEDCWMIGDSAARDVCGAAECGLRSIWIGHGRPWPTHLAWPPTSLECDSFSDSLSCLLPSLS